MALIVFTISLFVSAFLLFLVQPMIGKMILPKLGGTPQVWNTCMLFFQTVLLAGYFYTHATTTYLKPRKQMMLHGILLFLPLLVMLLAGVTKGQPFDVSSWVPPAGSNPIWSALLLLLMVVGVPFFVVSTSAPLLQKWFSFSGHETAGDPYFLYGASNFGSMLSLAAYPFIVEPNFAVPTQTWIWFVCYIALMILFFGAASLVWKQAEDPAHELPHTAGPPEPLPAMSAPETTAPSTAIQTTKTAKKKGLKVGATAAAPPPKRVSIDSGYNPQTAPVTPLRCLRWALLAAVPSSLMLGVTSYVSTDLSPFPLVWAIPLALYLLTFILVFAKWPLPWTKEPHQLILLATPLFAVPALCLVLFSRNYAPVTAGTFFAFLSIFIITLAMHGELAKDRPAARKLTLFFLLMSFGGMLGGLFNAMIAPLIFTGIWEYPLAIIVACMLLPNLLDRGFVDGKIMELAPDLEKSMTEASDNAAKSFGMEPQGKPFLFFYFWDIVVGSIIALIAWYTTSHGETMRDYLVPFFGFLGLEERKLAFSYDRQQWVYLLSLYGVPLLLCIIVSARSWRMGLGIAGLLFFGYIMTERTGSLYSGRSYFGVLKVFEQKEGLRDRNGEPAYTEAEDMDKNDYVVPFNFLMHGSTYHGRNYQTDKLARLATTYYHRFGPVGVVMEKYNWLPGKQNTYYADTRIPASLVGLGASGLGTMNLPLEMITDAWSEPPYATVGLGTGSMASYGRPFQHVAYYEIDDKIRNLSLPKDPKQKPYFRYVKDALDRGANVEIIMGDARLSLEKEEDREKERIAKGEFSSPTALRNGYYKVLVLDAFSSDAIPVHLITEEAIKLYMQKLTPDGVLCVHTSNRHLELIKPVADIAKQLDLDWLVAHDPGGPERSGARRKDNRVYSLGHFSSEYIMLFRKAKDGGPTWMERSKLENAIKGYPEGVITSDIRAHPGNPAEGRGPEPGWYKLPAPNERIWTDNYQNIVSIMR